MKTRNKNTGSAQAARLPKSLEKNYFRLDDRSVQDMIVAAHEYARLLRYFNLNNAADGDWSCFWRADYITLLATVAALDTDELRRQYEAIDTEFGEFLEDFDPEDEACATDPSPEYYRRLLQRLRDMAEQLERLYLDLKAAQLPLADTLLQLIRRDNCCDDQELQGTLAHLIRLHKAGDDQLSHTSYQVFFTDDNRWGVADKKAWDGLMTAADLDRVQLRAIFITFLNTFVYLKNKAQQAYDDALAVRPQEHPPHIALFLTFLNLFKHLQDDLNDLTNEHLDFYYEKVLGFERRPAQPDQAYLVFTLAKEFNDYMVNAGTALLGGAKNRFYETLGNWKITQAKLEEVKNWTILDGKLKAAPVANSADGLGGGFEKGEAAEWRLFGDADSNPDGEYGIAIAGPVLWMEEGERTITLNFNTTEILSGILIKDICFSTEEGWTKSSDFIQTPTLNQDIEGKINLLQFTLPVTFPPVVPVALSKAPAMFPHDWPVMKIFFTSESIGSILNKPFTLNNLTVNVTGLEKTLIIETPLGVQEPGKEIQLFGNLSERFSECYIGSNELSAKPLDNLHIKPIYLDDQLSPDDLVFYRLMDGKFDLVPNSTGASDDLVLTFGAQPDLSKTGRPLRFEKYETQIKNGFIKLGLFAINSSKNYFQRNFLQVASAKITADTDIVFKFNNKDWYETDPFVIDRDGNLLRGWDDLLKELVEIFKEDAFMTGELYDVQKIHEYLVENIIDIQVINLQDIADRIAGYLNSGTDESFYLLKEVLKNKNDFANIYNKILNKNLEFKQHSDYIYTTPFIAKTPIPTVKAVINPTETADEVEQITTYNIPGSPTVNKLTVNYTSTVNLQETPGYLSYFNLYPFDGEAHADTINHFADTPAIFSESLSYLFLGFSKLKISEGLSLLFHLSPGTELEPETEAPAIRWSYLAKNNTWIDFRPGNILADTTRHLTRTGMMQFIMPSGLSSEGNTLLNPALNWIRATAISVSGESSPAALPSAIGIYAQVVSVELSQASTDISHLAAPLPAYTISKLALSDAAIKKIEQPLPSFNGRLPESAGTEFYRRVSERLRHKDRAITPWDYERLLLEKYPAVAKTLCIPHTAIIAGDFSACKPGYVLIATIPDISQRITLNSEPRFSRGDLGEMCDYLIEKSNLFLDAEHLLVTNPLYEQVKITAKVALKKGFDDPIYYKLKLDSELKNFLAPWMFDKNALPAFGKILQRSTILYFIEKLPYIDFVEGFEVSVDNQTVPLDSGDRIIPKYPRSVFTTVSNTGDETDHAITIVGF